MKNYKDRLSDPRCGNCDHCFISLEYDEEAVFYCTEGTEPRPEEDENEWDEWAEKNKVDEVGICDNYLFVFEEELIKKENNEN